MELHLRYFGLVALFIISFAEFYYGSLGGMLEVNEIEIWNEKGTEGLFLLMRIAFCSKAGARAVPARAICNDQIYM